MSPILLPPLHADLAVYCCRPALILKVIRGAFAESPGVELHFERFSAPPIENGVSSQVKLGAGGPVLDVAPDKSALETVLAGSPDHRDTLLTETPRAEGRMLLCVSRADGGRLVLDI